MMKQILSLGLLLLLLGSGVVRAEADPALVAQLQTAGITLTQEQLDAIDGLTSIEDIVTALAESSTDVAFLQAVVAAAVTVYPDSASSIVSAAVMVAPQAAGPIVSTAISTATASGSASQVTSIVTAAVTAAPTQSESVRTAAIAAAPTQEAAINEAVDNASGGDSEPNDEPTDPPSPA